MTDAESSALRGERGLMTHDNFEDYLRGIMNSVNSESGDELGGFLVPKFILSYRSGIKAELWRFLGHLCHRDDWYERGIERIDLAELLKETVANYKV